MRRPTPTGEACGLKWLYRFLPDAEIRVNVVGEHQHVSSSAREATISISPSFQTRPRWIVRAGTQSNKSAPPWRVKITGICGVSSDRSVGHPTQFAPGALNNPMIGPYAGSSVTTRGGRPRDLGRMIGTGLTRIDDSCGRSEHPLNRAPTRGDVLPASRSPRGSHRNLRVAENPLRAGTFHRARHFRAGRKLHIRNRERYASSPRRAPPANPFALCVPQRLILCVKHPNRPPALQ